MFLWAQIEKGSKIRRGNDIDDLFVPVWWALQDPKSADYSSMNSLGWLDPFPRWWLNQHIWNIVVKKNGTFPQNRSNKLKWNHHLVSTFQDSVHDSTSFNLLASNLRQLLTCMLRGTFFYGWQKPAQNCGELNNCSPKSRNTKGVGFFRHEPSSTEKALSDIFFGGVQCQRLIGMLPGIQFFRWIER